MEQVNFLLIMQPISGLEKLSIGYEIPVKTISFLSFVKGIKISAVGRNLFWLYRGNQSLDIPGIGKRKMWFDPDMSLGNANWQGVEYGTLPSTRSYRCEFTSYFLITY